MPTKIIPCILMLIYVAYMHNAERYTNAIGIFSHQGNRTHQDDRYFYRYIQSKDEAINEGHLLGVLDGYNGSDVAHAASVILPVSFEKISGDVAHRFETSFFTYDTTLANATNKQSGAMATVVFIKNNMIHFAQLGTTGALVEKEKKVDFVTQKHLPNDPDERKRIESSGGHIEFYKGAWRIEKWLSMSRTFGGHIGDMKKYVIADPTCTQYKLTQENKYLILATSEFWKVMKNEDILPLVYKAESRTKEAGQVVVPRMLAWILGDEARKKDAGNVTVAVVDLLLLARSNCEQNVR